MYGNVLIVDDSKVSRMITKKIVLEISPNISILEAASGDEALELLKSNEPEAAILDFHMPGLTGLELAEKLKDLMPNLVITMNQKSSLMQYR
jgi:two-component system, chemotaxis family, chemotaxis protein CheY